MQSAGLETVTDNSSKRNFMLLPEFIEKKDNQNLFKGIVITRSNVIIENNLGQFSMMLLDCPQINST
ncbi:MAG: hypothetical protein ABJQ39_08270 [Winogradskyella arenosi]